jgi:glycosyltransferase involved in cell wall biosynthesis
MKLSIIVPVYNEKETILEVLSRLGGINFDIDYEIIIVDDGSTDGTTEILKSLINTNLSTDNKNIREISGQIREHLRTIFLPKNCGKGAALRRGFQEARGDIIAIQDADLEYNPQELPKLIQSVLKGGGTEVVYGSRFLTKHKPGYKIPYLGNRFLSFLFWLLYGKLVNDPWTCYKIFKKDLLNGLNLESSGFELEIELTAKFLKCGYKILEIPISYKGRTYAEGKKIKIRDGLHAILTLIKYRLWRT